MAKEPPPLLSGHTSLRSRDLEEVRAHLATVRVRLELDRRGARNLDVCLNNVSIASTMLGYHRYGTDVEVARAEEYDGYAILCPLYGSVEMSARGSSVSSGPSGAIVVSPTRAGPIRSQHGARLHVRFSEAAIRSRLTALLGDPPATSLELAPEMSLIEGHGRSLANYLRAAIADLDATGSVLRNPITAAAFEEFMINGLLLAHPNNYSVALRRRDTPISSRDVRRAIDYTEAQLRHPITLTDIIAASGVPGRTLLAHFKHFLGVSPARYLYNARFQAVRQALLNAKEEDDVANIASNWGFEHLGRFAAGYRQRFGERPSETLRERRSLRPSASAFTRKSR